MTLAAFFLRPLLALILAFGLLGQPLAASEVHVIKIFNNAYQPATLTVRAGDSVRFENWDPRPHTANAIDGSWKSGPISAAGEVTIAIVSGMKADYMCLYHPGMRARLEVME